MAFYKNYKEAVGISLFLQIKANKGIIQLKTFLGFNSTTKTNRESF